MYPARLDLPRSLVVASLVISGWPQLCSRSWPGLAAVAAAAKSCPARASPRNQRPHLARIVFKYLTQPSVLKAVGRDLLSTFFESFRGELAANGVNLPGPESTDDEYFQALAMLIASPNSPPGVLYEVLVSMENLANPDLPASPEKPDASKSQVDWQVSAELIAIRLWLGAKPRRGPGVPPASSGGLDAGSNHGSRSGINSTPDNALESEGQPPAPRCRGRKAFPKQLYALRQGLGLWKLTFAGKEADLKHEQGILYVAYLLKNPPSEPIHALDLAVQVSTLRGKRVAMTGIIDPATGKTIVVERQARIQERTLSLDDAETRRAIARREKELQAILDDEGRLPQTKADAMQELQEIVEFQKRHSRRSRDSGYRAADSVRKAIGRFHRRLLRAVDPEGRPYPVLAAFAAHLETYLLIPSFRYARKGGRFARTGLAGRFTYEPPPGIIWSE